jgi:hypothetical protein
METMSESIGNLALALSKAQSQMSAAKMDSENPFFKSKYADLASVWDACRKPLTDNELAVVQTLGGTPDNVEIITTLIHKSGEWIRGAIILKPVKADPQGVGSAITYGRRYGITAILGIIQEDDDGNAASNPPKQPETKPNRSIPKKAPKQAISDKTPETQPDISPKGDNPPIATETYLFPASIIKDTPMLTFDRIREQAGFLGLRDEVLEIIEGVVPNYSQPGFDPDDIPDKEIIEIIYRLTGVRMGDA